MDRKKVLSSVIRKRKNQYDNVSKVVIGRKAILGKCKECSKKYNIVKVYCYRENSNLEYRIANQHVCLECGWNVSPYQAEIDFLSRFTKINKDNKL